MLFCVGVITGIWSLIPLLGVKIVHLVCRSDLFAISNLVYGGRESCNKCMYSSLEQFSYPTFPMITYHCTLCCVTALTRQHIIISSFKLGTSLADGIWLFAH